MTQKFTINNFKQELKELAQLQHDEKLFFKHPERYPNFIKDHEDALLKEYRNNNPHLLDRCSIPYRLKPEYKDNLVYQSRESQTHCNYRRSFLSDLYEKYYILKHWKKLNIDDNQALFDYFFSKRNHTEEISKKTYIDNSPEGQKAFDELKKMYHDKLLSTSEFYHKQDQLKRISWFDYTRNELLSYIDKEE